MENMSKWILDYTVFPSVLKSSILSKLSIVLSELNWITSPHDDYFVLVLRQ